jgi:NitT/TauT family transport system substrate-binding protein
MRSITLRLLRWPALLALTLVVIQPFAGPARAASSMHIAFGDIASVESIGFLIAIERAKERGVDVEVTYFKSEDLAAQAVVGGQADIGVGTPYALLQKVKAPIRIFFQLSSLRFFPMVDTDKYQTWADLDGEEIVVHSRGSGTEAIMNLMAQRHGISYSTMSYVPGSEVRAGAMLQGNIHATIVDSANRRILQEKGGDRFAVLPMEGVNASDEALYANQQYLEQNAEAVDILVEELLATWREINQDPDYVVAQREHYGLLADLPADLEDQVLPYYEEAKATDAFPNNGGGADAAKDDFDFYALAGQLEGDPGELKVEDFWDLGPLERALENLGRV